MFLGVTGKGVRNNHIKKINEAIWELFELFGIRNAEIPAISIIEESFLFEKFFAGKFFKQKRLFYDRNSGNFGIVIFTGPVIFIVIPKVDSHEILRNYWMDF